MYPRSVLLLVLLAPLSVTAYAKSPLYMATACAWSLAVAALHLNMERTGRCSSARGYYFAGLAACFLLGMHLAGPGRPFTPYCHVGLAANFLHVAYNQYLGIANGAWLKYGALSLGIGWLAVVLVNGGGFCSWICFFGGIDDACSRTLKKPPIRLPGGRKWRVFQLAALVFFAFMSFHAMEPVFCRLVCPFKSACVTQDARHGPALVAAGIALGAVLLVILPALTGKRTFCSSVCPFGAIPPLVEGLNPHKITVRDDRCTGCGTCETVCPSFAIEREGNRFRVNRYCTRCLRCVESCPSGALESTLFHRKGNRNLPFVSLAFGGALGVFYVPGGVLALVGAIGRLLP